MPCWPPPALRKAVPCCSADQRETHWQVERIWPCLNGWQPMGERSRRFAIDPREQLLAQKWGRARALTVLGAAHSHPASAAPALGHRPARSPSPPPCW